mmetsp:Transcript_976/g.1635  ORF Transcript_976/g.1635 Transcript_976/m.1635 type:complete len:231 (+) Transcript_976:31-723(+)
MATVGSLKPLRANSGPLKFVQKQFVTALGDRSGNFKLSWAAQVKTTRDQVDTFEERRTELEKEAGDDFESKECWFFGTPDQTESIVKNGFIQTFKGDSVTFAMNPAVAVSQAKHTGDVAQNKDNINRLILCRVSIGKEGKHQRSVGKDDNLKYVIPDVRGVIASFVIGFKFNLDDKGAKNTSNETNKSQSPSTSKPSNKNSNDDDSESDDDAAIAKEMERLTKHVKITKI